MQYLIVCKQDFVLAALHNSKGRPRQAVGKAALCLGAYKLLVLGGKDQNRKINALGCTPLKNAFAHTKRRKTPSVAWRTAAKDRIAPAQLL